MANAIQVIKRSTIPPVRPMAQVSGERTSGEVRDFRWNDRLRDFMPSPSQVSVSWVTLEPGEVLHILVHPAHSLIVVYSGSGELTGEMRRAVARDEVVVIPAGCRYGFAAGSEGLSAVSIALGERLHLPASGASGDSSDKAALSDLIVYSGRRCAEFEASPIFRLLQDGTLDHDERRALYLARLQVWAQALYRMHLSRQVSSRDVSVDARVLSRLGAGSDPDAAESHVRGGRRPGTREGEDPILVAIADWFVHQMFVLDGAEKATIVELVLESAGNAYARCAGRSPHRSIRDQSVWPGVSVSVDSRFDNVLAGISHRGSERLNAVAREAWDMLDALSARMEELTCNG